MRIALGGQEPPSALWKTDGCVHISLTVQEGASGNCPEICNVFASSHRSLLFTSAKADNDYRHGSHHRASCNVATGRTRFRQLTSEHLSAPL